MGLAAPAAHDWDRLARRAKARRKTTQALLIGFLVVVSAPVMLPYFWMLTISFSARTGGVEALVLWRACAVLMPAVFAFALLRVLVRNAGLRLAGNLAIAAIALVVIAVSIGGDLHGTNWRFLWTRDVVEELRGQSVAGGEQFPWVWTALLNSLVIAVAQTIIVVGVATLAGYYISRFRFRGRAGFLKWLLVLHAIPAMTLVIPIFLMMHWTGLLNTLIGVILVIGTLELPFAIFIMKGFFDAVPWEVEMSAMTDGASRRQAFLRIMLPQVKFGIIAIAVFAFIKGWEEYVFVRTLLFDKSNWVMSLYLFWVSDDIMGVDYGIVAAVAVFYILPSLLLYVFCQRFLAQLTLGGIKG
ncbi:MAG: carbohydrate ABC transporter permease [Gammaproteobacteria bacterium]|nr:carbohydrate ABC transporter permease [Gammaproteobacteria bacterium]